ncbi:MAG: deoxyribonuclease IV [Patescibacteria group bacterium]|nr:deoxyribonuclease IV [Patescibacteria group bacterium]
MLFGYHVSASGGLSRAFVEAEALQCDVIQIFVGSPQIWTTPLPDVKVAQRFKEAWKKSKVKKVLVHAAYLPNPASHKASLRNMSLKKLKDEAKIAYGIGADGYNFHCGSNQNSNAEGITHTIQTLNRLEELTRDKWPVKLIIENDAGAGNRIGDTIEELGAIWKGLKHKQRFGFCLDTCHLFVSGVDVRTKVDINDLLKKFDRLIGLKHLEFIHANDARFELGSKKDRHAKIGEGFIGEAGFKNLVNHPRLKNIPFILETPRTGDVKRDITDIKHLRRLVKK